MKKLADLTEADTEEAYNLGEQLLKFLAKKQKEPMIAVRAFEMVAATLLQGAKEIEGRSILEDFIQNVRENFDLADPE